MVKHLRVLALGLGALAALAACAGVADLDVKYTPQEIASDGGTGTPGPGTDGSTTTPPTTTTVRPTAPPMKDAASTVDPETLGQNGGACPCDEGQGLACCSGGGNAACLADQTACDTANGAFLRCFGPDIEGSYCCLHRYASSSETALAGTCAEGTSIVCTFDTDCPNGKCTLGTCPGNVTIGTCDGTPVCPPPPP